jgi:hypothetical protein
VVSVTFIFGVTIETMKNLDAKYSSRLSLQLSVHLNTLRPKDPLLETLAPESGQ